MSTTTQNRHTPTLLRAAPWALVLLAAQASCSSGGGASASTGGRGGASTGPSDAGAGAGGAGGSTTATGDTGGAVDASAACMTYCDCMHMNCPPTTAHPEYWSSVSTCLTACATETKWDLPCRQNMCTLVPDQPANDHCTHAMGEGQCLDMP
jgi:hypothetical protein